MAGYVTLSRQAGLLSEMQAVAHNLANLSTTGFRREGILFSEYVHGAGEGPSVSIARAHGRVTDFAQGALRQTGGALDLAIEGEGFFLVEGTGGPMLSRAGAFAPDADGVLRTPAGEAVLDEGGAPLLLPVDAGPVAVGADGTVSTPLGPVGRLAVVRPAPDGAMSHAAGTLFRTDAWEPAEGAVVQGALESSNVDPVLEVARMVEVQRAYEAGAAFLEKESERRREALRTLTR